MFIMGPAYLVLDTNIDLILWREDVIIYDEEVICHA